MIRGVLFDMDGLMFDTERIGHRGWKYGAQVLGLELPDEVIAAGRGMSVADSRAMYLERLGPEVDYDALRALRVAYADEAIARDGLPVKPACGSFWSICGLWASLRLWQRPLCGKRRCSI